MFKQFIHQIPGADLSMIISLLVFILFFIVVGIYLLTADKKSFEDRAQLPLQ